MNQTETAFPCVCEDYLQQGLSKREYFAIQILASRLASDRDKTSRYATETAVRLADELIIELDKTNENKKRQEEKATNHL